MKLNLRTLRCYFAGLFVAGLLVGCAVPIVQVEQEAQQGLQDLLPGSWTLRSYTYTSNNRTYTSPDEMEATVNFDGSSYSIEFAAYIVTADTSRTRLASESGTYTVDGDQIRLNADEASSDTELGEEILSEVKIEGNVMTLVSNDGNNREVWERIQD